ncbi:FHA domain-containing protein [Lignipirellula cremea]|uniref:FHA domain-containing protein FhaA n=1 Tax=Lignipirellula cremea TaxID=2528010 RepID=A0A518DLK2_9BACT|nr:FHA domain-containing protein [Lignipirellula cremea]QDU92702.1 FHA domain-containing protein FhaA [Lignipirellula cremea]
MSVNITLRVLDGSDRGRVFDDLSAPITIGREEGNTIQLNDERVSRYHVKIQEDHDKLVLTDLESTNGTKVNGEDIQLRILRFGDMITVGRSVLLYGTREQIAQRLARLRGENVEALDPAHKFAPAEFGVSWDDDDSEYQSVLHALDPPELPERLSPGQAAQLSELIEYFHIRLRRLASSVDTERKGERVSLDGGQWQNVLDLQSRMVEYLRNIGEPPDEPHNGNGH